MMLFKVDENLHAQVAEELRNNGHDAETVYDQQLRGASDETLADVCRKEGRALVTLDLDFANILTYPPQDYPGLIVIRLADQSRRHALRALQQAIVLLDQESLSGYLWIVEEHRVRIRGESKEGKE